MPVVAHTLHHPGRRAIQIEQDVAGILVGIGVDVDVAAFTVADAQEVLQRVRPPGGTDRRGWMGRTPRLASEADNRSLVLFDRGDEVTVQAGDEGIRFLLVSGKPLQEPVAWYGPMVMNTQEQLRQAFQELEQGTFLKPGART